jgi:uncharacterized SAM-binding protein YcdF (DUF218 family)
MFFILSKTLGLITVPSNLIVMVGLAGVALLFTRWARTGTRLLVASVILTVLIGVLPIGTALIVPLEERFPPWDPARGTPTGVIVLGGVIGPERSIARAQISLDDAAERVTVPVELAHKYPKLRLVFAGGNASFFGGPSEADFAVLFFEALGVSRDRIAVETQSRNTAENAAFSKRLIAPKPGEHWLLVTSALQMPRAMGAFCQAGFQVEAFPVDYQTDGYEDIWNLSGSLMGGVHRLDVAVHEWLGLLAYWITGRIPVLFPGPDCK